jgi:hypothetical protein
MSVLSRLRHKIEHLFRRDPTRRSSEHHQSLPGEEEGFVICGEEPDSLLLVQTLARAFSSGGHLMIEGHLKDVDTAGIAVSFEIPSPLSRHTTWSFPNERVLVVPLEPETIEKVCSVLLPSFFSGADGGVSNDVTHVQIERDGRLEFGAYDWFEIAWVSRRVDEKILVELRQSGVIEGYAPTVPEEPWPC